MADEFTPEQIAEIERIVCQHVAVYEGNVDELASQVETVEIMMGGFRNYLDKHVEFHAEVVTPRVAKLEGMYQRMSERIEALFPKWRKV